MKSLRKGFGSLKNQKGFTLIELLIVLIILAVLVGLAVPLYTANVRRSFRAEALQVLGAARDAEIRFFAANAAYTANTALLDFDPAAADASGQTRHFNYAAVS